MGVTVVPDFWSQLGQALSQGSQAYSNTKQQIADNQSRQEQLDMQRAQFIADMVDRGEMDAGTANKLPVAQKFGIKFQPSVAEQRRKLISAHSAVNLPSSLAGVPGPGVNLPSPAAVPAGTPDQRAALGLPSTAQITAQNIQQTLDNLRSKYISQGPTGLSDSQLTSIGQPTQEQQQITDRANLDKILAPAADRYTSGIINNLSIDTTTDAGLAKLTRQAASVSKAAYQQYLKDQAAAGSQTSLSPKDKAYAKSFFDNAVAQTIQTARQRNQAARVSMGRVDTPVQTFTALRQQAADIDRQIQDLRDKNPQITNIDPADLDKNPAWKAISDQINSLTALSTEYKKAASEAIAPLVGTSGINTKLNAPPAAKPTASALPPTGQIKLLDPQAAAKRILNGTASKADLDALLKNKNITQDNYDKVMSAVSAFLTAATHTRGQM